jgi:hypothetical protein
MRFLHSLLISASPLLLPFSSPGRKIALALPYHVTAAMIILVLDNEPIRRAIRRPIRFDDSVRDNSDTE